MRGFITVVAAASALAGCSTSLQGTAPAKEGYIYAVGSKVQPFIGQQPEIWLCPNVPKKGDCQLITVTTEEQ